MVAREGFVYEQKPLSVTRNVVVREGWSLVRVVVRQGFYCITIPETWVEVEKTTDYEMLQYQAFHKVRSHKKGGGVAI